MQIDSLFSILKQSADEVTIKLSDSEHPIFKAHFPSQPILPGFIHFEIVSRVFNIEITEIKKAKFSSLVLPKQIVKYIKKNNKFSVLFQDKEVASFSL